MKNILLYLTALLLCFAACKKESVESARLCPNLFPYYSYINGSDSASCLVPNIFSPDGDGHNDYFKIITSNIATIHVVIKDGMKIVYDSTTTNVMWKGFVKTPKHANYNCNISGTDVYGNAFNLSGTISSMLDFRDPQNKNPAPLNCDSCRFVMQYEYGYYDSLLPTGEYIIDEYCE